MNDDVRYAGSELQIFARAVNWKNYFSRQLRPFVRGRVLEVGAGIGGTTRILATGREDSWTCLEPDCGLADELRQAAIIDPHLSRLPMQVVVGFVSDLPVDSMFDCILYIDVLEHIADDNRELQFSAERLLPGGHLVVLSPAWPWLFSPFDKAIGHYRRYNRKTLQKCKPAKLTLTKLTNLDSVGLFASLANRFLLKCSTPSQRQILFWDRCMVPLSRILDPITGYQLGKSIMAVWSRS
jgi:SAM-dependent methyltransferase